MAAARYMGLINIFVYLLFIALSWWALQQFRFDVLLRQPKSAQGKMLQIFLSIALGYELARFFLDYLQYSLGLQRMF
ncbi:membrane protein [Gordoniibacillus kamchatkensis]|uniref:Membrane protein n=1 Tax=Gordoniibacillus kamchatkensis TaxID=1590651 RepID=A0ABR5AIA5_9BACL|nr:DUF1146 family protein [Paenibacillus sp. VKM B-2647]KIL40627.1 membrane protein [Paenibacillus sp. VKM B-2647]